MLQTLLSFKLNFKLVLIIHWCSSADIWSVGCTVIEMATGKPPWSHEYQEVICRICLSYGSCRHRLFLTFTKYFQVSLLYYVGTTKSHPPIPEHLSTEAKDFLLKCLQKYNSDALYLCLDKLITSAVFLIINENLKFDYRNIQTVTYKKLHTFVEIITNTLLNQRYNTRFPFAQCKQSNIPTV